MRIAHVLTRLLRAGSEQNTLLTCQAQAAAGHEVYVIHGRTFDSSYYQGETNQPRFVGLDDLVHAISPRRDCGALFALRDLLLQLKPDIVHTHQSKAGIIGRFAARLAGVPCVVHGIHIVPFAGVGPARRIAYLAAERAAGKLTDAFISVSAGIRDLYLAAGIGKPEQHFVVHSGFDLARFRHALPPANWSELLRLDAKEPLPPVLLMIAAFEPRKRHRQLLDAFPLLTAQHPQARLILVGEGPLTPQIESQIVALGLERNVILTGYRRDPEALIALADLCLLTSQREGLPRVLMQYLAAGKPCVACELPGLNEVLRHNVNGLVVRDVKAAIEAAAELIRSPAKLRRLGEGAASTDLSSWEASLIGNRTEAAYAGALREPRVQLAARRLASGRA